MKRTILIICGNRSMNYILKTVVESKYDLIAVTDVFEGMKHLRQNAEISLVVVDTDFQQKECLDLVGYMKSSFLYNKPVFVLSSLKLDELEGLKRMISPDLIISKPFNPTDLLESLDNHFLKETEEVESRIF